MNKSISRIIGVIMLIVAFVFIIGLLRNKSALTTIADTEPTMRKTQV